MAGRRVYGPANPRPKAAWLRHTGASTEFAHLAGPGVPGVTASKPRVILSKSGGRRAAARSLDLPPWCLAQASDPWDAPRMLTGRRARVDRLFRRPALVAVSLAYTEGPPGEQLLPTGSDRCGMFPVALDGAGSCGAFLHIVARVSGRCAAPPRDTVQHLASRRRSGQRGTRLKVPMRRPPRGRSDGP